MSRPSPLHAPLYREARPDDAAAIAAMFAVSFRDTFGALYQPADLASFLAGNDSTAFRAELNDPQFDFQLAEDRRALAGYIKLGPCSLPIEPYPASLELRQLYVLKDWHGSGVAVQLFDWAIERARARGARHLQLSVYVDNHRARRFYERRGFAVVGSFDFMVGSHRDDERIMRLSL